MVELLKAYNSIGEIAAGLLYLYPGLVFFAQFYFTNDSQRKQFRFWAFAFLFAAGLEELADAFVEEGSGLHAYIIQSICTTAQVITGGIVAKVMTESKMLTRDFQQR